MVKNYRFWIILNFTRNRILHNHLSKENWYFLIYHIMCEIPFFPIVSTSPCSPLILVKIYRISKSQISQKICLMLTAKCLQFSHIESFKNLSLWQLEIKMTSILAMTPAPGIHKFSKQRKLPPIILQNQKLDSCC